LGSGNLSLFVFAHHRKSLPSSVPSTTSTFALFTLFVSANSLLPPFDHITVDVAGRMNHVSARQHAPRRRPLGELDPNRDLNIPRGGKRAPITYDTENAQAVIRGIETGLYDADEVMAWTNYRAFTPPAPVDDSNDFSDDPGLTQFTAQEYPDEDVDDDLEGEDMEDEADHEDFGHPDDDQDLLDEIMDEDLMDHMHDQDEQIESDDDLQEAPFDPAAIGLKEINNLAHFGVSSHKPGNGVEELLSDDVSKFWQ